MRLIVCILFSLLFITIPVFAAINLDEIQIKKEIKQLEANKNAKNAEIIQALQVALNWLSEAQESEKKPALIKKRLMISPKS